MILNAPTDRAGSQSDRADSLERWGDKMASSRKDAKGYALHTGECQRSDGRYAYSYTDPEGTRRTVYAKSLAELRQKERKIIRDMEDGIDAHFPERLTLNQLYEWNRLFRGKGQDRMRLDGFGRAGGRDPDT